jgi:hypothetical protein
MSTATYGSRPQFTLNWSNTAASYVIITYVGNAIVGTATTLTSGAQTGTSWTSGDLSLNATYTFTLTPYNQAGIAGTGRTMTIDTTPTNGGSLSTGVSTGTSTQITWSSGAVAGSNISFVRIYRQITSPYTGSVEDICAGTYISSSPYYDNDISGNTTYTYTVYPYDAAFGSLGSSTTFSVAAAAAAARDLSATYYDASSIQISFTLPKNSYSSSYYYQLNAVYSGTTTSVSGTTSPLWVTGLTGETSYTCYVASYLDGTLGTTSAGLSVTTSSSKYYNFSISFGSSTVPTTDDTGTYTVSKTGSPTMYNDSTRGYVISISNRDKCLYMSLYYSTSWTISYWIYKTSTSSNVQFSFYNKTGTVYGIYFQEQDGRSKPNMSSSYSGGSSAIDFGGSTVNTTNSWIFEAITYNGTTATLYQYGSATSYVQVSSSITISTGIAAGDQVYLIFGALNTGAGASMYGYMDNIKYYYSVLSSSEIAALR